MINNKNFEELFREPTSEYRGAPFWAWNTKLSKDLLERQLPVFKEMGFGGYHVHPRTGLDTEYLSDSFMDMVRFCADYAKKNSMICYGYDEDRFPSGAAGGIVTRNKDFRQRQLIWSKEFDENISRDIPVGRCTENYYLGKYVIKQDEEGFVTEYRKIDFGKETDELNVRYAYVKIAEPETWFNNNTYVDTMYKPAMDRFIEVTHKRYFDELGEFFGDIIPSFFTDEPKVTYKKVMQDPFDENDVVMPWTDDFPCTLKELYDFDIVEYIPELFMELSENRVSKARYLYHRHIMERFCESFSNNIGKWCEGHNVALSGHMVKEPKLSSQSISAGEVMAPLSGFGIPGIDMLCDAREYTTAKQAQSIKDQYGRSTMLSELYGVTNWHFDFRGHKLGGDWQAALGVNLRVPHLAWMSMKGEAKRDYPASIFYQSPWYKKYKLIEDHFARVNVALNRGKRVCKIGLIHPVESCWNHWGVKSQTKEVLKDMDNHFKNITEKLLFSQLDFDYISESLLPSQYGESKSGFIVGNMKYEVVVVPCCESIRSTTKNILDKWIQMGGRVVVLGDFPTIMDGERIQDTISFDGYEVAENEDALIDKLIGYRDYNLTNVNNAQLCEYLVQERCDNQDYWYFIAKGRRSESNTEVNSLIFAKQAEGIPYLYDTMSGKVYELENKGMDGVIEVPLTLCNHDSALICIKREPISYALPLEKHEDEEWKTLEVQDKVPVCLSEDNVFILDKAQYYLDGNKEDIQGPEEILRMGQLVREKLGIPLDGARMAQPWTKTKSVPKHTITVKYKVNSKVEVFNACLALEDVEKSDIYINGKQLEKEVVGYFADEAIKKVLLPPIRKGENTIEITLGIGEGTDLEAAYLLGEFSVFKDENGYYIDKPVTELYFGDVTSQGLPFYGGNITYDLYFEEDTNEVLVEVEDYKGSLIEGNFDGEYVGDIIFDPYKLVIKDVKNGKHVVGLVLYGNRVNTFGPLHNKLKPLKWVGPEAFRSRDFFTYDYELTEFGIMSKPVLKAK